MKKDEIIDLLKKRPYSPADLQKNLSVSATLVHRYLKDLCEEGVIEKIAMPPNTYYRFLSKQQKITSDIIESNFMYKDSLGTLHLGTDGFNLWSEGNLKKDSLEDKITLYEKSINEMQSVKKGGVFLLDEKMNEYRSHVGGDSFLQKIVCSALFSIPSFGKTKESILLGIAKEGNTTSKKFGVFLLDNFFPVLLDYIKKNDFEAVAFVPASAERRFQLMNEISKRFVDRSDIPVIPDLTFYIPPTDIKYGKVLLVDDMVGSGATLNKIAEKLITENTAEQVYGIGIVGEKKGFKPVRGI